MELTYQIGYDETISRWNVTAMGKEPFHSPKKTFEAGVNMEESYVQVVYPVREAFLKEERIRKAQRRVGERRRRADDTLLRAVLLLKVDHMPSIRASWPQISCTCSAWRCSSP